MRLLIKSTFDRHYYTHGFGALINKAILISAIHYKEHKNWDIAIDDPQLNFLYKLDNDYNSTSYRKDLIWGELWENKEAKSITREDMVEAYKNVFSNYHIAIDYVLNKRVKSYIKPSTIGIHARGTDKATEYPRVKIEKIIKTIHENWVSKGYERIFLATDDNYFLEPLIKEFGELLYYDKEAAISYDGMPIHLNIHDVKKNQRNFEALAAGYCLSKCKGFAYCESNISRLVTFMTDQHSETFNLQAL